MQIEGESVESYTVAALAQTFDAITNLELCQSQMEAGRPDFDTAARTGSRRRRRKSARNMSDHPNALVRVFVYHLQVARV